MTKKIHEKEFKGASSPSTEIHHLINEIIEPIRYRLVEIEFHIKWNIPDFDAFLIPRGQSKSCDRVDHNDLLEITIEDDNILSIDISCEKPNDDYYEEFSLSDPNSINKIMDKLNEWK